MQNLHKYYYSENWGEASAKFVKAASNFGDVKRVMHPTAEFDIPYISIGSGPDVIVLNSGVHGLEGYFGSAAQLFFLMEIMPMLSPDILKKYTIVLIHVINGWGMENRMREVMDRRGGWVDLNRNFGVDFSKPDALPKNELYKQAHDILLSPPHVKRGQPTKKEKLLEFRKARPDVWASISRGQYYEPHGLFYGGSETMPENKMAMRIYDTVMTGAKSLLSVGFHTGLGHFDRKKGQTTAELLVSHPSGHPNTNKFKEIFDPMVRVVPDENAVNGPTLLGDLVDCLEQRYKNVPVLTADFEIGTGQWPVLSPVLKRMDMGDARYDLLHYGRIGNKTLRNLTESWYPSDAGWRASALKHAEAFFLRLLMHMEKNK